jgi:hypothetical protein
MLWKFLRFRFVLSSLFYKLILRPIHMHNRQTVSGEKYTMADNAVPWDSSLCCTYPEVQLC